jgi:hypothetical protein
VYTTAAGVTSYKQHVGGWGAYKPAPYTCPTCAPVARSAPTMG